jgi:ATP-dependent DNA helicase PIF1
VRHGSECEDPGTGKSVLLRAIIRGLHQKHSNVDGAVAVTGSTGIAARNMCVNHVIEPGCDPTYPMLSGGSSIHSFFGIGTGRDPVNALVKKVQGIKDLRGRWNQVKVVILDEGE